MKFNFNPSSWFNNIYPVKDGGQIFYALTNPNLGDLVTAFRGGYSEANMMLLGQSIPELMFVCNAIASRVKNGVFKLVSNKDGSEVTDNALWNKMRVRPNFQFTFAEFIWHAEMHQLLTGNRYAFSYVPGVTSGVTIKHKNITHINLLPPHYVMIIMKTQRPSYLVVEKTGDYVDHYHYNGGDAMSEIEPQYVTHDIYMKMGDSTDIVTGKGVSPLKAGEYPLSNLIAVYAARNVIYVKRGPLGIIISAARDSGGTVALTPEEKQEVEFDLMHKNGVQGHQSPMAFTNQPVTYMKTGSDISELEPFRETEASCAALCGILGVPVSLMPKGTDAKFANLDIAERNLYENVIFDRARALCAFLDDACHFSEVGCHLEATFDHVTCLQDDAAKAAAAFKDNVTGATLLYDGGHITQNEVREFVAKDPIEGGDQFKEDLKVTAAQLPPQEDTTTLPGEVPVPDPIESDEGEGKEPKEPKKNKNGKVALALFGKKANRKKLNSFSNI